MLIRAALVIALAGCGAHGVPPTIPDDLRSCAKAPAGPDALAPLVTPQRLRAQYVSEREARLATVATLEVCAGKLDAVVKIAETRTNGGQ